MLWNSDGTDRKRKAAQRRSAGRLQLLRTNRLRHKWQKPIWVLRTPSQAPLTALPNSRWRPSNGRRGWTSCALTGVTSPKSMLPLEWLWPALCSGHHRRRMTVEQARKFASRSRISCAPDDLPAIAQALVDGVLDRRSAALRWPRK